MQIHKYKLDNGLNVIIKDDNRAEVALCQIWYKVGSSYEKTGKTGISHMLEHMMFKGTDKYSKQDLNSIVENNGGVQNAFTSYNYTAYYQFWHKKNLDLSFSIESSRMSNLKFDENEFMPENKVVIEERNLRVEDNPVSYAHEHFMKLAYIDSRKSWPIIGWMDDIKNYTLNDLKEWYEQNYAPNNASIVVVGDVDHNNVLDSANKYFGDIKPSDKNFIPYVFDEKDSLYNKGYRHKSISKKPNDLDMVIMGYICPSLTTSNNTKDIYALMILSHIIGASDSSRLQKSMVRDNNYCCHIDSDYSPFCIGEELFSIHAVANSDYSAEFIEDKIHSEISKIASSEITEQELTRAKTTIKSDKIFSMDSIENQANIIGSLVSIGLDADYDKYLDNLYDVTIEDIHNVIDKYLVKSNLACLHLIKD